MCFVGDGINDAIALKKADVSISLRGASTMATDTAQIILMDGSLNQLIPLFDLARELNENLKTCLIMAVVPGTTCIGGVFLLHFGLLHAILLYNASLFASVSNAMWPVIRHQREQSKRLRKIQPNYRLALEEPNDRKWAD